MTNLFFKYTLFLVVFISANAISQNGDIELLREIHVERNASLDPTFSCFDKSLMPLMIGAPISVLSVGVIKKDISITRKGLFMMGTFA